MAGGEGHDTLIGSSLFWQAEKEGVENNSPQTSWILSAGAGNDIVIPYIFFREVHIDEGALKASLSDFVNEMITSDYCLNEIKDVNYQITTGKGSDIIALSSRPAKNVTTHIKDFNWDRDRLAFDNQEMAEAVLPELIWSKKSSSSTAEANYKGHQYTVSNLKQTQLSINLKTKIVDGIEIQYPDLGQNIKLSCDYALYNAEIIAEEVSFASNQELNQALFDDQFIKKTFLQTYTNNLNENIFVTTKQSLDLVSNDSRGFKVYHEHLDISSLFRTEDLFVAKEQLEYDYTTSLYGHTNTGKIEYIQTKIPKNVVAVIVVQENSNGLIFTTQSKMPTVLSTKEQFTQVFTASDFFTKGHFTKVGDSNLQNRSVTMKLGLVLKGEKENQLITTPLGDPTLVRVGK